MSSLIELAADFFEHMTNPAFGAQTNEAYALRFAALLGGETNQRINDEAAQLRSTDALTPYGWTWLLGWAKTSGTDLDPTLLLDLCEKFESTAFKATVIDAATVKRQDFVGFASDVHEFRDEWLGRLLTRAIEEPQSAAPPDGAHLEDDHVHEELRPDDRRQELTAPRHSQHARSLLMALLFVDRGVTIDAAATLLRHDWTGQAALLEFFWSWIDQVDDETRDAWRAALEPPEAFR